MPRVTFLILDDNSEGRFMLSKTLLRKFPQALIHECADLGVAMEWVAASRPSAVLVHRSLDADQAEAIGSLREALPSVPIVALSGDQKRENEAREAGATKFLHYDKWLLVGSIIADLLIRHPIPLVDAEEPGVE